MIEHMITADEAHEVLDFAQAGEAVEVWMMGLMAPRGLLIVEPTMEGDFRFTHWASYAHFQEPAISIYDHDTALEILQGYKTIGINT